MFGRRAQVEHFVEVGYVVCGCLTMCSSVLGDKCGCGFTISSAPCCVRCVWVALDVGPSAPGRTGVVWCHMSIVDLLDDIACCAMIRNLTFVNYVNGQEEP